MKRLITIIVIVGALAAAVWGAYTWWNQRQAAALEQYQTTTVNRGSLTATVGATGIVHPNQTAILAWQTSGTVERVMAAIDDLVQPGETMAELQSDSLPQSVILARSDLISAQKALEDLQNSQVARQQAWLAVLDTQKAVIEVQRLLDYYSTQNYRDELDDARQEVVDAQEELDQAEEDFEPYQDWDPENSRRKELQEDLDEAQLVYDEAVRLLDLLEMEADQAQANLDLANAQLADAQRRYNRLEDGPDPDEIAMLETRITAAQAALDLAFLEAPFAGTLTEMSLKPGDKVTPGSMAFRLDDLSRLLVDVRVSEVDINRVKVGQEASLTFDAILGSTYQGLVSEVARIGSITQGVVEFVVTIELLDADENVRPGMTAAVNIIVEQLENVLLVPNRAVRILDGQRVVYVLRNDSLQTVRISLGATSDINSQVLNGDLVAGDLVVLNPPQVWDTNGPPPFVRR